MSGYTPTNELQHLQQSQLGSAIVMLLERFGDWLETAHFEDVGGGSQRCVDMDLRQNLDFLLPELGISTLFGSRHWGYTIWRIAGPSAARFRNSKGEAYIYPIRVYSGPRSTISGLALSVGEMTYIKEEVTVTPALVCLFVVAL
ncbi:hypothetical protein PVAG01_05141 [Phlyctema vagabunda]|uniref:Uncharacterized protein n=1 Tax=Phlyctema vagabunda TaxID=108571 RepID=A0ABR4PJ67_9HELO